MAEITGHTFRITGRVIDRKTRHGTSGLRVEAWDKDHVLDDFVGSATTDAEGSFEISFDASYFQEWNKDQLPDLFFKVYDREALIANTEDSVLYNVQEGAPEVRIEVDRPAPPEVPVPEQPLPVERVGMRVFIRTQVPYSQRRVYRLIGRDLYSAPLGAPLAEQTYTLIRSNVIDARLAREKWRVVVRDREVCLES